MSINKDDFQEFEPYSYDPGRVQVRKTSMEKNRSTISRLANTRIREHLPFYLVVLLIAVFMAVVYLNSEVSGGNWAWMGLPLDDNWIHLVYARSFAEEGWFYYNPGTAAAGMSSPFWVVMLAIVHKVFTPLGMSPQWVAKSLSLAFSLAVPIAVYHVVLAIRLRKVWAWTAGLLVVVEPNLAYGTVAGMEVALFSLLTLSAILASWRKRYILTGALLGLLVVTRGEGVINAVLIGAGVLVPIYLRRRRVKLITRRETRIGAMLFLLPLVLGGAWALYNFSVSGNWLPNTFFVKHNFGLGVFNLENLGNVLMGYFWELALFRGPLFIASSLLLIGSGWFFIQRKQMIKMLPLWLIPLMQVYAFSINIKVEAVSEPWTYFTRRYLDHLLPLLMLLMVIGASAIWKALRRRRERWVVLAIPAAVAIAVAMGGLNTIRLNGYFIEQYSWNTRNIEEVNVAMGRWIADNLPEEITIGVTDAGAMRYYGQPNQSIIDFLGLNCWQCIGRPMEDLLLEYRPSYVAVFRQALTGTFDYEEVMSIEAERNTILGGSELVLVRASYP